MTSFMKLASMAPGHANLRNQIKPSKQQMATSKIGSGAQFALQQFCTAHVSEGLDIGARNKEVRFTPSNGHPGPDRHKPGSRVLFDHSVSLCDQPCGYGPRACVALSHFS